MGNDLTDLKAAVDEFEGHGLYETDGGYSKASRKLEYLELVRGRQDIYLTLCSRVLHLLTILDFGTTFGAFLWKFAFQSDMFYFSEIKVMSL